MPAQHLRTIRIIYGGKHVADVRRKDGAVWYGDGDQVYELMGTESKGWLERKTNGKLYDSALPHPEFPHLTGDLQHVEKIRRKESILG